MVDSLQFFKEFGSYSYKDLLEDDYQLNHLRLQVEALTGKDGEIEFQGDSSLREIKQFKATQAVAISVPDTFRGLQFRNRFKFQSSALKMQCCMLQWRQLNDLFLDLRFSSSPRWRIGSTLEVSKALSVSTMISAEEQVACLSGRAHMNLGERYSMELLGEMDLTKRKANRFNALVAYKQQDWDLFVRHEAESLSLGSFFVNGVRREGRHVFGGQLKVGADRKVALQVGLSTDYQGLVVKTKVDTAHKSLLCSIKGKFNPTQRVPLSFIQLGVPLYSRTSSKPVQMPGKPAVPDWVYSLSQPLKYTRKHNITTLTPHK